jgi:hypothetical protein
VQADPSPSRTALYCPDCRKERRKKKITIGFLSVLGGTAFVILTPEFLPPMPLGPLLLNLCLFPLF